MVPGRICFLLALIDMRRIAFRKVQLGAIAAICLGNVPFAELRGQKPVQKRVAKLALEEPFGYKFDSDSKRDRDPF
ncbi:MAG: hypothetical protein KGI75_29460 [Rhizobiaceae bacterium]|nr:hypothetical protein [Rhizobiaceae bacterium]